MSTSTAAAVAQNFTIKTALSVVEICTEVHTLLSGLTEPEQKKILTLLQPLSAVSLDEKERQLSQCQKALFALLLAACSGDDERILEVFQASKFCRTVPLCDFLRRFLLSEKCCRRHMCRYLSFCCTDLDAADAYNAFMTGVYSSSFTPQQRTEIMYVSHVRDYLRRDTVFVAPLSI